jgi:hypothetical protein
MHLLTTYTHHSELQVITALSLISTLYKSSQHLLSFSSLLCLHQPFPSNGFYEWKCFSFTRSGPLVTASHAEFLSAVNSNIAPFLLSLPYRAQLTGCPNSLLFITPRRGPRRQHPVSPVACVTVSAVSCLPNRCPETGMI